ncbi:hypothetical protein SIN8267_00979 [Sinobacterium norvegicum]|uniref:Lipoprotein n=1 Tax=Sinobacterium norvegicum TaxID=1641715 RepID=A0ABN8EIB8_9GAMM|nr:hypothetical protein [Sinobacterium norvegicum]CAH0990879.1 hypothetical protein SIN8267_00979 [Sinobacterium norvegicum]
MAIRKITLAVIKIGLIAFVIMTVSGCSSLPKQVRNLAKSDIDFVIDVHAQEQLNMIEQLTRKLYTRNPKELNKAPQAMTVEQRIRMITGPRDGTGLPVLRFKELRYKQGVDAMNLGLDKHWQGDRVFAVVVGLTGMLKESYHNKAEFYILDSLDQQSLYNSARNVEVLSWKITHRFDLQGRQLLLTDYHGEDYSDHSFDRLFARMAMVQDMMADIVASKTDRGINTVVHGVAKAFLPVGI